MVDMRVKLPEGRSILCQSLLQNKGKWRLKWELILSIRSWVILYNWDIVCKNGSNLLPFTVLAFCNMTFTSSHKDRESILLPLEFGWLCNLCWKQHCTNSNPRFEEDSTSIHLMDSCITDAQLTGYIPELHWH